ncbi:hypothetical protein BQ9231_00441 [Cedratvirus lausannensis]|uniref:Uncharacterized protein n=1 Tax=Cedratvirus lausannensis TaxID=2023205 RepID=A0A285PXG2_9VIRU|nr:hypothetical protein BQ9231_00441 [Cedratvirus lausannensis]
MAQTLVQSVLKSYSYAIAKIFYPLTWLFYITLWVI